MTFTKNVDIIVTIFSVSVVLFDFVTSRPKKPALLLFVCDLSEQNCMVIPITNSSKENLLKYGTYRKIDMILNEPDRFILLVEKT